MPPVAEFGIDDPPVSEGFGESDPAVETFGENDLPVTASQTGEEAPTPTDSPNVAGAKAAWEALNKPFLPVPRVTGAELKQAYPFLSETSSEFIAGTQRGVAGLIEGVENPLGVAVGVAGAGAKFGMQALGWMAKTGAAAYAALMAKHLPEGAAEAEVAFQQKDWERGMESAIGTAASAVLVPVIAGHLAPKSVVARVPESIARLVPPGVRPTAPVIPFVQETARAMGSDPIVPRGAVQEASAAPMVAKAVSELPPIIKEAKAPETPKTPETAPMAEDMGAVLVDAHEMAGAKVKSLTGFTEAEGEIIRGKLEDWVREEAEKFQAANGTLDGFLPEKVISTRVNTAIEFVHAQKRGGGAAKVELDKPTEEGGTVGEVIADTSKDPASAAAEVELSERIADAVDQLPPEERQTVRDFMDTGKGGISSAIAAKLGPLLAERGITAEDLQPIFGMGAAIPAEFLAPKKFTTGNKNAVIDQERAERGLPPMTPVLRRSWGTALDEAHAKIDADATWLDRLILELREKPRAIDDWEGAGLDIRRVDLTNEFNKAANEGVKAADEGRLDDAADAHARANEWSNRLTELDKAAGKGGAGTALGRGLAIRRMMLNEDFSLANLELKKRAARNFEPLTDAERTELQKTAADYKAKADALEKNEAERTKRAADEAVKEAIARIEKETPKVSPPILRIAERIVASLDKRAEAARLRLKDKFSRASAGVDPTIILDLAEIGAAKIGHIGLDFAKWSAEMVKDFGEKVKPFLDEAWIKSQELIDGEADKHGKAKTPVKRAVTKAGATETVADATAKIKAKAGGDPSAITADVQKLVRGLVEGGIKDRDALVDAVHAVLKESDQEITRRDAADAISGYGKYKLLSKDEISVQVRDLKGQLQQVAKLEDMQAGQAPSKTGIERRTPSDEERRLIKQVEEAKKKGGYTVTDPATQLRSALQATQRRLENQIADLSHEIENRAKIVKEKAASPTSPEIEKLRVQRDKLREERDSILDAIRENDPVYQAEIEARKLNTQRNALLKSIAEKERKLREGDLAGKQPQVNRPADPVLESLKQKRDTLTEQIEKARDAAKPKRSPEEIALQAFKTRATNRIAELEAKLKAGDFNKKIRREIKLDPEATRLKFELDQIVRSYHEGLMRDRLARRTVPQKILAGIGEAINTFRVIMTSFDLSAVLRQGGFIALGHPVRAVKALPTMFRALASEADRFRSEQEILVRPNYQLYQQSKLYLAEHGQKLSQMEEAYMSRWSDKIPGVAASQRAYTTFLNRLRADSFDAMAATLSRDGKLTPVEAGAVSNFINVATGRGHLGMKENALVGLNTAFFAPRYVASRFQLLGLQPLYRGTAKTRALVASEYARYLMGVGTVYGLAQLAGAEIETDPRSSDFGKLKWGNTRVDPLSGLQQATVLLSRLGSGETKTLKGKAVPIRGKVPFGGQTSAEVTGRFLRSKLSPAFGTGMNIIAGENVVGEPVTPTSVAADLMVPLGFNDIYKTMIEQGVPAGTALGLLSIFGMGVQTYDTSTKK